MVEASPETVIDDGVEEVCSEWVVALPCMVLESEDEDLLDLAGRCNCWLFLPKCAT